MICRGDVVVAAQLNRSRRASFVMGATCVNEEVKEMGLFKKKVLVQTYDKENKKPVIKSSYGN